MDDTNVGRRDVIRLALSGLAMPAAVVAGRPLTAFAQTGAPQQVGSSFSFSSASVANLARTLATKPYQPPAFASLGKLADATPADAAAIRYRPNERIWVNDNLRFVIEPLHRTGNSPGQVELQIFERGAVSRLNYDPGKFEFGNLTPPAAQSQLGFTGFVVHHRDHDGELRAVASIRNAEVLAAIARDQVWGVISRPLTVRTADQQSEAPHIRAMWIEKPRSFDSTLVMHALVDMASLTGAFRFTLRVGDATLIDTECTIFTRRKVDHLGLTPIHATHLIGPLDRRDTDDIRPAVYETTGVEMLSGRNEWIWRPVTNRSRLQISAFVDKNPQGFGLIQRDRSFDTFVDDENSWQRRPTVWVEPIGEWGPGEVTLMEIPAAGISNKNIACYWRTKPGLEAGAEAHFAYRQYWSWRPPERPNVAITSLSRTGRAPPNGSQFRRRFLVQFSGGQLSDPNKAATIVPNLWTSAGKIVHVRAFRAPKWGKMRIVFDLDPEGKSLVELRLVLELGGAPMSETWLFRWTA